jgi:hypothetical protein
MKRFPFEDAQKPAPPVPAAAEEAATESTTIEDAGEALPPLPPSQQPALDPLPAIERILTHPQVQQPAPVQRRQTALEPLPYLKRERVLPAEPPEVPQPNKKQPIAKFEPFTGETDERVPMPLPTPPARQDTPDDLSPVDYLPARKTDPPLERVPMPARKGAEPDEPKVLLSDAEQVPALPSLGQAVPAQRAPDPTQVPQFVQRRIDGLADLVIDRAPAQQSVARVPSQNTSVEPLEPLQAEVGAAPDMQQLSVESKPYREPADVEALLRKVTPRRERSFLSFGSILPLLSEEGV